MKDCSRCKHYEKKGFNEYSCKYLREKKTFFESDGTDTAEGCKYFEETSQKQRNTRPK